MENNLVPLGVDISKGSFDVHVSPERKKANSKRFANTDEGRQQAQAWLVQRGMNKVHVCMEATGTYSDATAIFFCEQGHQVSIINPARLKSFRESEGLQVKTDKQDAFLLALFCAQKRPGLWQRLPEKMQELQVLMRRIDDLQQMRQQEKNRLENERLSPRLRQGLERHLQWLKQEEEEILEQSEELVKRNEELKADAERVDSIPGLAILSAMRMLSCVVEVERYGSAKELVSHLGLAPVEWSSGTSVNKGPHISKQGDGVARKWLYMCALTVMRWDKDFKRWVKELEGRGKKGMVIVVAVMRKLTHVIYGVLKTKQEYDPHKAFPSHYEEEGKEGKGTKEAA